jgi:hypothetical protein
MCDDGAGCAVLWLQLMMMMMMMMMMMIMHSILSISTQD